MVSDQGEFILEGKQKDVGLFGTSLFSDSHFGEIMTFGERK